MRRDLPPFVSICSFEAAARRHSFKAAADELNVTQSAISHQVKSLEEFLGVRLFVRGTREIVLTNEGMNYLCEISPLLDQLVDATDLARNRGASGPLYVTTTPAFAARWLVPRLTSFAEAHPKIELHVATSLASPDFARDQVDVAVRFKQDEASGLLVAPILSSGRVPVASPQLMKGRRLREAEDLRRLTLLHDEVGDNWQDWVRCAGFGDLDVSAGPRFAHCELTLRAAVEAQGVALAYSALIEDDLAKGRLVRLSDVEIPQRVIYTFVTPQAWATRPKIAAFLSWLQQLTLIRQSPVLAAVSGRRAVAS